MHRLLFLLIFSSLCGVEIRLGEEVLSVEIATTHETRAKGLMGRESVAEGTGMLFVYPHPQILTFWMKNTLIPLSIAFFDEKKQILNIVDMPVAKKGRPLPTYSSSGLALYALEVPQGWFTRHKIGPGAKFSFLEEGVPLE
jgi:hypothetical protein